MKLSRQDKAFLDGERGKGAQIAMRIVVRMAEVVEAAELMNISQAHIDGCGLLSDAGLEFAETLAAGGSRVSVPTTLNMGPLDLQNWEHFGVNEEFAAKAIRRLTIWGC